MGLPGAGQRWFRPKTGSSQAVVQMVSDGARLLTGRRPTASRPMEERSLTHALPPQLLGVGHAQGGFAQTPLAAPSWTAGIGGAYFHAHAARLAVRGSLARGGPCAPDPTDRLG